MHHAAERDEEIRRDGDLGLNTQMRTDAQTFMTQSRPYRIVTAFCEIFQFNQGAVPKG
jgi:hypothetical protein